MRPIYYIVFDNMLDMSDENYIMFRSWSYSPTQWSVLPSSFIIIIICITDH